MARLKQNAIEANREYATALKLFNNSKATLASSAASSSLADSASSRPQRHESRPNKYRGRGKKNNRGVTKKIIIVNGGNQRGRGYYRGNNYRGRGYNFGRGNHY